MMMPNGVDLLPHSFVNTEFSSDHDRAVYHGTIEREMAVMLVHCWSREQLLMLVHGRPAQSWECQFPQDRQDVHIQHPDDTALSMDWDSFVPCIR